MAEIKDNELYKLAEVAKNEWLGVGNVFTIRGMIQAGRIKAVNISKDKLKYNLFRIKGSEIKKFQNHI